MKNRLRMPLLAWGILLLLFLTQAKAYKLEDNRPLWPPTPDPAQADSPASRRTFAKLYSISIPLLKFKKADPSQVLEFLTAKSKELDPKHVGIIFRLETSLQPLSGASPAHGKFSSNDTNVPIALALIWFEVQTGLAYRVTKGTVVVSPDLTTQWDTSLPPTSPNHRFGQIVGQCVTGYYDVPGGNTLHGKSVKDKLNSILLPKLDFEHQDLANILKILAQKSRKLDPQHVGVQICLNLTPIRNTICYPIRRDVDFSIKPASLAEVLAQICSGCQTGYSIEKSVVVLRPDIGY